MAVSGAFESQFLKTAPNARWGPRKCLMLVLVQTSMAMATGPSTTQSLYNDVCVASTHTWFMYTQRRDRGMSAPWRGDNQGRKRKLFELRVVSIDATSRDREQLAHRRCMYR